MIMSSFNLSLTFVSTSIYSLYTFDLNRVDYDLPYSELKVFDFSIKSLSKLSISSIAVLYVIGIIPFIVMACIFYMSKY